MAQIRSGSRTSLISPARKGLQESYSLGNLWDERGCSVCERGGSHTSRPAEQIRSLLKKVMKIIELNHVAIYVRDVEKSCEFYSTVLRLERMPRPAFDFPGAWFRLGTAQELHIIGGRTNEAVVSAPRGDHFALKVDDVESWRQHLQPFAAIVRGPVKRPDGATQIFIVDPDGHIVELFTGPLA